MPPEKNEDWYCSRRSERLSQGDIIRELNITINSKISNSADFSLTPSFSYGVILSQDCDLQQHYDTEVDTANDDKLIETVLVCPAFPLEQFLLGDQIAGKKMNDFQNAEGRRKMEKRLRNNDECNRYHYLPTLKDSFPQLVIDFKRFYTVPINIFEASIDDFFISSMKDLYKERLSQRFTNYLGRIGLPE